MSFSRVRTITTLAVSAAAVLALPAGTAVAKTPRYPVITKVTPMQVGVGDLLTIKGRGFRSGKNKNTVVFKRFGQRAIFIKAETATSTAITLHVPLKLQAYMKIENNVPIPSLFAIRIIAKRFGQKFTSRKLSPMVGPAGSGIAAPGTTPPSAYEQCLGKADATPAGDEDKDSLSNGLEKSVGLDPCTRRHRHGWPERWLGVRVRDRPELARVPLPRQEAVAQPARPDGRQQRLRRRRPARMAGVQLFQYAGSPSNPTARRRLQRRYPEHRGAVPAAGNASLQAIDLDHDGTLTDDERDADSDGLSNVVEYSYTGTQSWWQKDRLEQKSLVARRSSRHRSPTDPDSDGDGVLDGADDQDVDGYDNYTEMQLGARGTGLYVDPFNPACPIRTPSPAAATSRSTPARSARRSDAGLGQLGRAADVVQPDAAALRGDVLERRRRPAGPLATRPPRRGRVARHAGLVPAWPRRRSRRPRGGVA